MNRKYLISGHIVSRLMQIRNVTPLELGKRLQKSRQAVYSIQQRDLLKLKDAEKILTALGITLEEVEEMESQGKFADVINNKTSHDNRIDQPENEYLKTKIKNIEAFFASENVYLREQSKLKDEDLRRKDMVIQDLVAQLGKKRKPVTNNDPYAYCNIIVLEKNNYISTKHLYAGTRK